MTSPRTVDVVVPVFNEGESLHGFHSRLTKATEELPCSFRFVYVNDGSGDNTMDLLADLRATDARACGWRIVISSRFPVLLPFSDAQPGRSFHPFDCRLGSVAR